MPRRNNPGFDDDIVRLVINDLRTVWALELLFLIRGARDRMWIEADLSAELRGHPGMVGEILRNLEGLDLVARDGEKWCYRPGRPELEDLCARTEYAYLQKPFAMISLIGRAAP